MYIRNTKKYKVVLVVLVVLIVAVISAFYILNNLDEWIGIFSKNEESYNIFLITIDSLRADHLSCYGYYRNTTPNICSLAEDGVLFENTFSHCLITPTSFASLLTSKIPPSHGIYDFNQALPKDQLTIVDILEKEGYSVIFLTEHTALSILLKERNTSVIHMHYKSLFIEEIEELRAPFFIWLHLIDPHYPYKASEEYYGIYSEGLSINKTLYDIVHLGDPELRYNPNFSEEDIRFLINRYDEEVKEQDDNIGWMLKELKRRELYEDSLIIISADQGEGFMEHGVIFHMGPPYDEQIHVPLIIKLPKNLFSNRRVKQPVRLIDLSPTVLDILKIEKFEEMQGVSLIPAIKGKDLNLDVFAQFGTFFSLRTENYKYIFELEFETDWLYDLKNDPEEKNDISQENPKLTQTLKKKLLSLAKPIKEPPKGVDVELTEMIKKRLRELGYLV